MLPKVILQRIMIKLTLARAFELVSACGRCTVALLSLLAELILGGGGGTSEPPL